VTRGGGELEVSRPSEAGARELLETLPPQSPLLTAWPSGPIGAAMVLGKSPLEVPLVAAIVEQHPEPGVAAAILQIEMERAEQAGDIERAKRLHRRIAYGPYESTPSWAEATINFPQLSSGPTAGGEAPDVIVTAADGEQGPLVASDRPTIVYAWSSYCGPCKQGPAHLRDLADAYGDRLAIVSLSIDDETASAETFRQKHGGMPGLVLDGAQNPGLVEDLGILGVPDVMIFDDGTTILRGRDWPKIERTLEQVVGAE
jgi:thiol-disulfide isomerase/thioredoxin